jgi:hypothetical protein
MTDGDATLLWAAAKYVFSVFLRKKRERELSFFYFAEKNSKNPSPSVIRHQLWTATAPRKRRRHPSLDSRPPL